MTILGGENHALADAVTWTGNAGSSTVDGGGNLVRYNPEDLLGEIVSQSGVTPSASPTITSVNVPSRHEPVIRARAVPG